MIRLAANLTMLYEEYPFFDRFRHAAQDGFSAVEFFFPYGTPAEQFSKAINDNHVDLVLFNAPMGVWDKGERGFAAQSERLEDFSNGIVQAVEYAKALKPPRINCPSGPADDIPESWQTLSHNYKKLAKALGDIGVKMTVEPVNHNDVPNALISHVEQAVRFFDKEAIDNAYVQYDLYHSLRAGEDPYEVVPAFIDRIDHIQIADVPGRHQPGTGAIDFDRFFGMLENLGYKGYVALEYHPDGDTSESLAKLREWGLLKS